MHLRLISLVAVALPLTLLAATADAAPLFDHAIEALGDQPCGGGGCWTNYLRVVDLDDDDDLDIVFVNYAGFFNQGSPQPLAIFRNNGGQFTDDSQAAVGGHQGRHRQVAIADLDGDGLVDLFAPDGAGGGAALFMNQGDGTFIDEAGDRLPPLAVYAGATRAGDFDLDGDLDLFIADGYAQGSNYPRVGVLLLNDGGVFTDASDALPTTKQGRDPDDVDLLDVDRDFDLDLVINMHAGKSSLWLGDGDGGFVDATDSLAAQPGMGTFHYNAAACDVDGDGDLDLWFDNTGPNYTEQLMINDGLGNFTDETQARVTGNPSADDNGVVCADVNDDGHLDAVVISLSNEERVLQNDGQGNFTAVADAFPAIGDPSLWGEFGDLDGDDRFDLVTGQGEGNPELNRIYLGNQDLPVDGTPPRILATEALEQASPDELVRVRFAVSDRSVTDDGPRLQAAWIDITGSQDAAALHIGGDLFLASFPVPDVARMTYRACARDLAGNEGCGEDQVVEVGGGGTDTTDTTDATDSDTTDATDSDTTEPTSESTDSETGETTAGPGTTTEGGETSDGTDSGSTSDPVWGGDDTPGLCECRSASPGEGLGGGLLLLFALAGWPRRARRR